ncbi:CPBP family intramembrane glutamic endopeptidase [Compostimonas suwonensis]|uniref:CAAX prenyl protease 2/Lysostaphin resistance protein A-like domain-containing protein n=1 Tax=Compostimonas suwonensis TaxID=1048394 RepID=A0A2M9BCB1_9MICO|nr:CPBP family intramembrane glutamic endopeptidase [Compostimonas suwonensis]PJJ55595.1 hypothetical protein CLV54_2942 [Compostimonas suwonensis]
MDSDAARPAPVDAGAAGGGAVTQRPVRWGIPEAFAGVAIAIVLVLVLSWLVRTVIIDPHLQLLLSYLVVWVPLLGACVYATVVRGSRSFSRDFGLRFTGLDLLWGVGFGLIARAIASVVEIAVYGRMAGLGVSFGETVYDGWWVFQMMLAPVLLAPVVEELFFRGLLQRAVYRSVAASRGWAIGLSVAISAAVFALVHLLDVATPGAALVVGLSTFVFGVGSGLIAAFTGRIGGSIVAHVTFNAALLAAVLTS